MGKLKINMRGFNDVVRQVIESEGVERAQRVADAANAADGTGDDGYIVSTEGAKPLQARDYRATVITRTREAQRKNAKRGTLSQMFHRAGGA